MKSRTGTFRLGVTALTLLTLSMASIASQAQEQGGPLPAARVGRVVPAVDVASAASAEAA